MPPVSQAQRRAMYAAASGHSTLGIPKKVGEEFTEADPGGKLPKRAKDDDPRRLALLYRFLDYLSGAPAADKNDGESQEYEFEDAPKAPGKDAETEHDPKTGRFVGPGEKYYHGTSSANLKDIQKNGIIPQGRGQQGGGLKGPGGHNTEGFTYVSRDPGTAGRYAYGVTGIRDEPEIHEIKFPEGTWLHEDPTSTLGHKYQGTIKPEWIKRTARSGIWNKRAEDKFEDAPKAPGKDDPVAPPRNGYASSIAFVAPSGKVLFVRRSATEPNWPDTWSLPGGRAEEEESAEDCAMREAREEIGDCSFDGMAPLETKRTPHDCEHTSYVVRSADEFEPKLNGEHSAYVWATPEEMPEPIHPGVKATIEGALARHMAEDVEFRKGGGGVLQPVANLKRPLLVQEPRATKVTGGQLREERRQPVANVTGGSRSRYPVHQGQDAASENLPDVVSLDVPLLIRLMEYAREDAPDDEALHSVTERLVAASGKGKPLGMAEYDGLTGQKTSAMDSAEGLALFARQMRLAGRGDLARRAEKRRREMLAGDRKVIAQDRRIVDVDGRLHSDKNNLTIAAVNPYYGREIPGWSKLGLDPDKKYMLLRDPRELSNPETVKSFNNLPILSKHVPVDAVDYHPELVIGSTGTDAKWEDPFITNSIVIWAKHAVDAVENGEKRELSAGYSYVPVMEPGNFKGTPYEGRMTQICANHLCSVQEGRAGQDVAVGDSALDSEWKILIKAIKSIDGVHVK